MFHTAEEQFQQDKFFGLIKEITPSEYNSQRNLTSL